MILEKIKKELSKEVNNFYNKKLISIDDFEYPPSGEMGDLALPCFKMSRDLKKSPHEISGELISHFQDSDIIDKSISAGPYLNFFLNKRMIFHELFKKINSNKIIFGQNKSYGKKRIMVEFSNVNTHKEYHVGHLRNLSYGDSVSKILKSCGAEVYPVSYINDFGIHTARTIWAYLEYYKTEKHPQNLGAFLGEIYVRASKELEKNEIGKRLVSLLMKKIESRNGEEYELWKKTRQWSIDQFESIYKEMGIEFVDIFYESENIGEGLKEVNDLFKKGVLEKSEGAIIANLEKYDLGVLPIIRSDGTALYAVADIPLARKKIEKYKLDESIYVVDNRQKLYFRQLFKIIELMGYKAKMTHLDHDFVKLPGGMMSSRSGNTITYETLKEEAKKRATFETKERHEDWSDYRVEENVKKIVNGAIKFEMLKVGSDQTIIFDIDKALRFDGYTAPYLQYTYARLRSIIRKSKKNIEKIILKTEFLTDDKEESLIMKMARFEEVVLRAGELRDPSEIAKYAFELSQNLNDYYHSVPILNKEENLLEARLLLINSALFVLKNSLKNLGIEVMEEM